MRISGKQAQNTLTNQQRQPTSRRWAASEPSEPASPNEDITSRRTKSFSVEAPASSAAPP